MRGRGPTVSAVDVGGAVMLDLILAGLLVVAVIAAVFFANQWRQALAQAAAGSDAALVAERDQARTEAEAAKATAAHAQAELTTAKQDLERVAAARSIRRFPDGEAWTLLAGFRTGAAGGTHWVGIARARDGSVLPYFVEQNADDIATGGTFTAHGDRLVPTGEAKATPAAAAVPGPAGGVPEDDSEATMVGSSISAAALEAVRNPNLGLTWLEAVEGADQGEKFHLAFDQTASIGRQEGNTIRLNDQAASRRHAEVAFDGKRFVLSDAGSSGGTFVNDQLISGPRELAFGDRVRVADSILRFTCDGHEKQKDDPAGAIAGFEQSLAKAPDFLPALHSLAFLLERDPGRRREVPAIHDHIAKLEG